MFFSRIINWGTFTNHQFRQQAVWSDTHPEHAEFLSMMGDELMSDEIVSLGNLTEYK